jgi:molybdopterin/thiamine biosynthesis adenylyltransferase
VSGGVLLIGAGGLGCATALGLAAAGVRRLGVVDDDVVDESNLHRQVLHRPERVGRPKGESMRDELNQRFPGIECEVFNHRFNSESGPRLLAGYDVLVDGSDNLATKFLANDAAVLAGKPLVHAAAVGVVGQLVSVPAGGRPCYRCLFEELPPADAEAPSCAEAGVLGPVPGVLGALQASEAVRFLAGQPAAFVGRLVQYDAAAFELRTVKFRRNPACRVCGDAPDIKDLAGAEAAGCRA